MILHHYHIAKTKVSSFWEGYTQCISYIAVSLFFGVLALLISFIQVSAPSYSVSLFATVTSSDEYSSIADKEMASNFFSETIVGWTYDPALQKMIGESFSARKQERSNIVLNISLQNIAQRDTSVMNVIKVLKTKLLEYNTQSNTSFSLFFSQPTLEVHMPNRLLAFISGMIGGALICFLFYEGRRFVSARRS